MVTTAAAIDRKARVCWRSSSVVYWRTFGLMARRAGPRNGLLYDSSFPRFPSWTTEN